MKFPQTVRFRNAALAGALLAASLPCSRGAMAYDGERWALLDASRVMSAAHDVTRASYPGCDEVVVDARWVRAYRPDGTGQCQDETWSKVLTERGREENRVLSRSFMLPYSTVQVVRLEVVRPDGAVIPVDVAANSKESIDDSQMEMNIYDPNSRVLKVNIPRLQAGDMVHSVTRETLQRPIIAGEYSDDFMLEGQGAIRRTEIRVYAPAAKELRRIVLRHPVAGTVTATTEPADGGVLHRWTVANVPRMYDEPSMPEYSEVLQHLLLSTIPDWKDVSSWYWNLSSAHLEASSHAMRAEVRALISGAPDDLAKAKAIFYYVSKNVRYMGITPEKDRPGFEPHDVGLTFDKKYGVCRDKAALLVAMLRLAGLRAYPALTNMGAKRDPDVPSPDFNHEIAAVCLTAGTYTLMDATDEHTRDLLPAEESNQSYLVCRPDGEGLMTSPVRPPDENMLAIRTTGTLSASGHLEATSLLAFGGINDNVFRGALAEMKPDVRRQVFERLLSKAAPGVVLRGLRIEPENMMDTSVPVHAEIQFGADGMTASGRNTAILSIPWLGRDFAVINYLLGGATLDTRKYPFLIPSTCGIHEAVALRLGPGYKGALSLPRSAPLGDASLGYGRDASLADGVLTSSLDFELKTVEFSPAQYLQLKATLAQLDFDNRKSPVLALDEAAAGPAAAAGSLAAAPPCSSDVQVLETSRSYDVQDAHAWVVDTRTRMKILTYDGKKENSEQKIPYDPACQEVRLVHAVVIGPDGKRQVASAGEEHRMDEGWDAGAGRYTGGKIFVVNLPGVEVGSVVDLEFQVRTHAKPFLSGFESFQLNDELGAKSVRIHTPPGLTLRTLRTGPPGLIREASGSDAAGNFVEWTAQDVKALPLEPSLPPDWTYRAGVAFFVGDETAYFAKLNELMAAHAAKSARAAEVARGLAAAAAGPADAVRAIRDYVARSIREAGPREFFSLPLSELSDADTTLSDGYGDEADVAILYHAMLAAAGLKPEFILASRLPPVPAIAKAVAGIPMPQLFGAPLVRVSAGGQTYYLNDTDQYAHLGSTPHRGRLALALPAGRPEIVEAADGGLTRTQRHCTIVVGDDGNTLIAFRTLYYGNAFNARRRYFAQVTPEDRRHYHEELVSSVAHGARPLGDLEARFDAYPGVEEFSVEVDHYAIVDGKYEYFPLPMAPPGLVPAYDDRRDLPYFIDQDKDEELRLEIDLPLLHRQVVIAPPGQGLLEPDGGGDARIKQEVEVGKLILTYNLDLVPTIVPAGDYEAMKRIEATLQGESARMVLLEERERQVGRRRADGPL